MEGKYRIGGLEFNTREEWESALKDLKKIKTIVDQSDIENPKEALFIYNLICDGKITFTSELGAAFFCDISDRVAENSRRLLEEDKDKRTEKKSDKEKSKKPVLYQMMGTLCVFLAVLSLACYMILQYNEKKSIQRLEEVQEEKNISQAINWYMARVGNEETEAVVENEVTKTAPVSLPEVSEVAEDSIQPEETRPPEVLSEYQALKQQYPDLAGWLRIEGIQVDLPVMQSADNEYYLKRDIDGNEDKNGTLFMDNRNDYLNQSTNLIIYGHNMKSGAMFGGLKQYLESSFIPGHEMIMFDTIYEKQTYQIVAVCLSEVGYQDDGKYKYYDFIQSGSSQEFQTFLESVRECAVYDNTQDVAESDKLLTLSTCSSYVEDGRLFVVAKKLQ